METRAGEVTQLLRRLEHGETGVFDRLVELVYDELHALARRQLAREDKAHTLQPTALVHEAYLKLAGQDDARFASRAHFLAVAATAMRRILVNHAIAKRSQKRGGGARPVALEADVAADPHSDTDLVAIDDALRKLADLDERKVRVIELRFFTGLSIEDTAMVLGVAPATVKRDFEMARTWLLREMTRHDEPR